MFAGNLDLHLQLSSFPKFTESVLNISIGKATRAGQAALLHRAPFPQQYSWYLLLSIHESVFRLW
jgi:hypothetical protein